MTTPRSKLIDPNRALHYHVTTRIVRGGFLCGRDRKTGRNYNHRKKWIKDRLFHLAPSFAIEVDGYGIMDNHFHLVLHLDPQAPKAWSNKETAARWYAAFPIRNRNGTPNQIATQAAKKNAEGRPDRIRYFKETLGSLSMFMKYLKQPIAARANKEDGCKGHFFEQRFYSGAILDQASLLAAMAYVDLNPVRAKIAKSIEECTQTSLIDRINVTKNSKRKIKRAIEPIVSGLNHSYKRGFSLETYMEYVNMCVAQDLGDHTSQPSSQEARWIARVASLGKRQRAYGNQAELDKWLDARNFRKIEKPLP